MINMLAMEGKFEAKPILLDSKDGLVSEFNLEHSVLTGENPCIERWRCRAVGKLATEIAERGIRGLKLTVQGELIQERTDEMSGDSVIVIVKILVHKASFGKI